MELDTIRETIDTIDTQLLDLFCKRLELAGDIAQAKQDQGKAIFDPARERTKLLNIATAAPEHLKPPGSITLLAPYEHEQGGSSSASSTPTTLQAPSKVVRAALQPVDEPFPAEAMVGMPGR